MVAYKYTKSTFIGSGDELVNVTELDCSDCNITSFKGLHAPNLTKLICYDNNLTSLAHLHAPNLTNLYCFQNNLTSFAHLHAPLLTTLHCDNNHLTAFEYLHAPNLTKLVCSHNNLTSLAHLHAPNLTTLWCWNNNLTSFEHLHAPALTELDCRNNNLTSLAHLHAPRLAELYCSYNNLTSFAHLHAPLLTTLYCENNHLTSFAHLHAPRLAELVCGGNEWEFIPPHINRVLNANRNVQNVYTDGQNVHNHHIQESIRNSIQSVLSKKPCLAAADLYETVLSDEVLTKETKEILVDYCKETTVHSTLQITFEELLLHVFSRIETNANKKEIKSVLNAEMSDSVCKCFTGRMSRLINCLNGFDDLVSIRISNTEQIGQIIGQVKERLEAAEEYTVEKHKEMATEELLAREYSQEVIAEWIAFIE